MNAEEMFNECGYKCKIPNSYYIREKTKWDRRYSTIEFVDSTKNVIVKNSQFGVVKAKQIPMPQLKAIYKMCQEKGWLDEC